MTETEKTICGVATTLDRDLLRGKNYVEIIPVQQFDIKQEFRRWERDAAIKTLWNFWHAQNDAVND